LILLLACASPTTAQAGQSAKLHVTFTPERLGQATTVNIGIQIVTPTNNVPSPLTELNVRYPGDLGIAVSGLGLSTCSQAGLETFGPLGCPADSRMGQGSALAEIQIGPAIEREAAEVAIIRASAQDGQFALLFYANGKTPVSAQVTFSGQLLPGPGPDNETIHIGIPLVPSLPGAPDVAITRLHATIGPRGLTYYEHIQGKVVPYYPKGILLPDRCPRGGFPFAARFTFQDGSHSSAATTVPCPPGRRR
jgi:hypothetical protein